MTEEQSILVDILKIVPDNSVCYINAPGIDNDSAILKLLSPESDYAWRLELTPDNKKKLTDIINTESIQDHFHRMDIKKDGILFCESYDGMSTVILPDESIIQDWFRDKYAKDGLCWNMKL